MASQSPKKQDQQDMEQQLPNLLSVHIRTTSSSSHDSSPNSPSNSNISALRIITDIKHNETDRISISRSSMSRPSISRYIHTPSNCTTATVLTPTKSIADNSYLTLSPINKEQHTRNQSRIKHYPNTSHHPQSLVLNIRSVGDVITQCTTNNDSDGASNTNNGQNNQNNDNTNDNGGNNNSGGYNNYNHHNNGASGDDEKKKDNDKHMDEYYDDIKDEEDEEDEEEDDTYAFDHTFKPLTRNDRSKSLNSTMICHGNVCITNNAYRYIPFHGYRAQGFIIIYPQFTEEKLPQLIKEDIANVWDFMDKTTGIALLDNNVLYVMNSLIINYGFHDKDGNEVYLVADAIPRNRYEMRERVYTKKEIYDTCHVTEETLPRSCVDLNGVNVTNVMGKLCDVFTDWSTLYEDVFTKWHKLPVFVRKKTYNKRRKTFALTKKEFLLSIQRFVWNNKESKLIPIIMFSYSDYRVEYVLIVKIESNIDIGISYSYDDKKNTMKATGIHLDKENILYQHQLIFPNHRCHCLDEFQSDIDDLHIGNPDDDKNRANALRKRNQTLIQKYEKMHCQNQQSNQEITKLKDENHLLQSKNEKLTQIIGVLQMQLNICSLPVTSLLAPPSAQSTPTPLFIPSISQSIVTTPISYSNMPYLSSLTPNSMPTTATSTGSQSSFPSYPHNIQMSLTPSGSRQSSPSMNNNNISSFTQNAAALTPQFHQQTMIYPNNRRPSQIMNVNVSSSSSDNNVKSCNYYDALNKNNNNNMKSEQK